MADAGRSVAARDMVLQSPMTRKALVRGKTVIWRALPGRGAHPVWQACLAKGKRTGRAAVRQPMKKNETLPVMHERAAGIDVGSQKMFASVAGEEPKSFGCCTADLRELRDWLRAQQVTTVAMEATGVYWLCLYGVLEEAGLAVLVVNGAHVKSLPGRKSDVQDCQWLATLHGRGLLRSGFVPAAEIRRLRDYQRLRSDLVGMAATHVQHMQKALERLNLKIHTVISSIIGVSGLRLIRAIVGGERDAEALLPTRAPPRR